MFSKDEPVVIVGAGIFGLSTSLHLAQRGYRDVTVFDRQPCDEYRYSYFQGAEGASADMNKIIRSAYGAQTEYQDLSTEAIAMWKLWNEDIALGRDVPPGFTKDDRVFFENGNVSFSSASELPAWEIACIEGMERAGHKDTQLATTDPRHRDVARAKGMGFAIDPFRRENRGKTNVGVIDSTGGMAVADKACLTALHKAKKLGVKFVLGSDAGFFDSLCRENKKVVGIKTRDGRVHRARMTILACGGWTPVLLPELDGLCEATAGSVVMLKIPQTSPLWQRFSPKNFPTWTWDIRAGVDGGLYGFPIDENGWLKIGYRGSKYINPITHDDGQERSTPATRWSAARRDGRNLVGERLTDFPQQAHKVISRFLDENLPELAEADITISKTRICWYTDSFDNHFIVDHVPDTEGLMVATGGSGHAFKYLPNIGNWVTDVMEEYDLSRPAIIAWRWRKSDGNAANKLMLGSKGANALGNIKLLKESQVIRKASALL